jgi:hypothetical protein
LPISDGVEFRIATFAIDEDLRYHHDTIGFGARAPFSIFSTVKSMVIIHTPSLETIAGTALARDSTTK